MVFDVQVNAVVICVERHVDVAVVNQVAVSVEDKIAVVNQVAVSIEDQVVVAAGYFG